jgi:hypothetical protein
MLLTRPILDQIVDGTITLVYRRWTKPTVKRGGRLRTVVGELSIGSVDIVEPTTITDSDAVAAGFGSVADLLDDLFKERPSNGRGRVARGDGDRFVYRIEVSYLGADTRIALRENTSLSDQELSAIVAKLNQYDAKSSFGPWVTSTLTLIDSWPGRRAPELAEMQGRETIAFKTDVRKLKAMGLTESLTVGYRLSPRGRRVWEAMGRP